MFFYEHEVVIRPERRSYLYPTQKLLHMLFSSVVVALGYVSTRTLCSGMKGLTHEACSIASVRSLT